MKPAVVGLVGGTNWVADSVFAGLQDGKLKLIGLVTELGEYLNSEDGATRSKSMYVNGTTD